MSDIVINVLNYNLFRNKLKSSKNKRAFIEVLFTSFSSIQNIHIISIREKLLFATFARPIYQWFSKIIFLKYNFYPSTFQSVNVQGETSGEVLLRNIMFFEKTIMYFLSSNSKNITNN